ncbi:MAG: hypothetical protein JXQ71_04405 [Verrucomicrobia bacterium]|nr:hypothetical protein [Verrucomicrobiota bacterium]
MSSSASTGLRQGAWFLWAALGLWAGGVPGGLRGAPGQAQHADVPFTIERWDTDRKLPQGSVFGLTQTQDGYLWFGTLGGLVQFDGMQFRVFDEGNTPGLNSSRIVGLFEDRQRRLWISTDTAGLALAQEGRVTSLGIGRGSRNSRLRGACEDASGAIWFYLADGQLLRHARGETATVLEGTNWLSFSRSLILEDSGILWVGADRHQLGIDTQTPFAPSEPAPMQHVPVKHRLDFLLASRRGGYWRLADGRVQRWRGDRLEEDWGPYPWSGGARVSAACEDAEGNLVVGMVTVYAEGGVFWLGPAGESARIGREQGLSHESVLSLCLDREGNLWVGTDGGGLNRVKRKVFRQPAGLRSGAVYSVCEDAQGGLWVGYNNAGASYWKAGHARDFGTAERLHPDVWAVFVDRRERVWAGTWGGLHMLVEGQFPRVAGVPALQKAVLAIHEDRQGVLWFGTRGGLVRGDGQAWKVFTTRDGLSTDLVRAIADDAEGNLWVGTEDGGLNRWRDGVFTVFRKHPDGLASDRITSLLVDEAGVLWIGTGSGLVRFHQGRWTRYTTREGLASNSVGDVMDDGRGFLWLGSTAGLMRLSKHALNEFVAGRTNMVPCRAYGRMDGLPNGECTQGSQPGACRARDGRLWFPTTEGLAWVDPARLQPNTHPPPVVIETVLLDGQIQHANTLHAAFPGRVVMPAGKERLEIRYTSLNLAAPERARFKYLLEGHETAWTEAGDARTARYSKLPPGQYTFRVTACNEDGVWNEGGSTLAVSVLPPFWRTWWFLAGSAAAVLGTLVAVVHYLSTQKLQRQVVRLRQEEALDKERSRIARDIHDQLGASLTQIGFLGEMIESDKQHPAEVAEHARQITQTARDTTRVLDEIVWAVNPSNDTLDGLVTYVCKHAQEYLAVAGLRYRLEVPDPLPRTPLPPEVRHNVFLAAKESVTNVVRHAHATEARLRLVLHKDGFTLDIEDNGRGLAGVDEQRTRSRNGLANMRKRMQDIGGTFAIGPGDQGGTRVRLTVPRPRE